MPNNEAAENNFTGGLKTEFTGLNFPENACTDTDNCVFTIIGDVERRLGINYEDNFSLFAVDRSNKAISTFRWLNVGGDGSTQVLVQQIGATLYFYQSSSATIASPLSQNRLGSTVTISSFLVATGTFDATIECQYTSGNGYLFVFHPNCEPFYCTYNAGTITGAPISIETRDFTGITESGVADDFRPTTLTNSHKYNLFNQGWTDASAASGWTAHSSTTVASSAGAHSLTVELGLTALPGDTWSGTATSLPFGSTVCSGTVTAYNAGTGAMTINITFTNFNGSSTNWNLTHSAGGATGLISIWFGDFANYPSNSDTWWRYKNASDVFDPGTTLDNVTTSGPSARGHYKFSPFNQTLSALTGISSLTTISTLVRPRTGCWFQGRVFYAGVDASSPASGTADYTTWTESIYFSQIIEKATQFGKCHQANDPTDEKLFDLLPSDGGVIVIQGSGSIYKLFPLQNGLLVFAANGIWFVTGSQGIGFAANDYSISKMSAIRSISGTSFVDVNGYPMFWNEEGIYYVAPAQEGGSVHSPDMSLSVTNVALGSILSFYEQIPQSSKKYVRGDYDPIGYVLQWCYRDTEAPDVTGRYEFNRILNFNTSTRAFYPWTISSTPHIHGITYVISPGGTTAPEPRFKYTTSNNTSFTFSEENDDTFVDWQSEDPENFVSSFTTGYKLHGKAIRKWQPNYIYVFSRNDVETAYKIQAIWNYASDRDSNRFSAIQVITNTLANFNKLYRRHRLRGSGIVCQLKFISVDGEPFDIMGWTTWEFINKSV